MREAGPRLPLVSSKRWRDPLSGESAIVYRAEHGDIEEPKQESADRDNHEQYLQARSDRLRLHFRRAIVIVCHHPPVFSSM